VGPLRHERVTLRLGKPGAVSEDEAFSAANKLYDRVRDCSSSWRLDPPAGDGLREDGGLERVADALVGWAAPNP
jgi:hypothetical protein